MKIFAIEVLCLAFLFLLPFTLGEVNRYKLRLEEKGTQLSEEIDIDERRDVGVFRVPANNDVKEGAEFYHDFKMGVTVTRILSRRSCYILEPDSTISSPAKLKEDIDQATLQVGDLPNETNASLVMITGPANRRLLTKEILKFCGALPIYNTEHIKVDLSDENGTTIVRKRRLTRDLPMESYTSCLQSAARNQFEHIRKGGCFEDPFLWNLRCMLQGRLSILFYYVTCQSQWKQVKIGQFTVRWKCKDVHNSYRSSMCCDFVCQT